MGAMQQALLMVRAGGTFQNGPQVNSFDQTFANLGDAFATVVISNDGNMFDQRGGGGPPNSPSFYYQPTAAGIGTAIWVRSVITAASPIALPSSEIFGGGWVTDGTWRQIGTGVTFGVVRYASFPGSSAIDGYVEFSQSVGGPIIAVVNYSIEASVEP